MSLLKREKEQLIAFIELYAKQFTFHNVPSDIIHVIAILHGLTQTAYILCTTASHRSSKIMKLIDIYNNITHPLNIYFTSKDNSFAHVYKDMASITQHYIVRNSTLPLKIKDICIEKYGNKLCSDSLFNSNKWRLYFHSVTNGISSVTALHPEFYKPNTDPMTYWGYNVVLSQYHSDLQLSRPIYNKKQQSLFRISPNTNLQGNHIYVLDLGKQSMQQGEYLYISSFRWKTWKVMDHIVKLGVSLCMIDNERFMAMMNAKGKKSYLYAMNETKLGIRLADACEKRTYAQSLCHDDYHRIITIDNQSAEWYDLNKNKAVMLTRFVWPNFVPISDGWDFAPFDRNTLYCLSSWGDVYKDERKICAIDLRIGQPFRMSFNAEASKGCDTACYWLR